MYKSIANTNSNKLCLLFLLIMQSIITFVKVYLLTWAGRKERANEGQQVLLSSFTTLIIIGDFTAVIQPVDSKTQEDCNGNRYQQCSPHLLMVHDIFINIYTADISSIWPIIICKKMCLRNFYVFFCSLRSDKCSNYIYHLQYFICLPSSFL